MERRVTPPRRVTSPTWGPPPPCKQALSSNYILSCPSGLFQPMTRHKKAFLELILTSVSYIHFLLEDLVVRTVPDEANPGLETIFITGF